MKDYQFVVHKGPKEGKIYSLNTDNILIGRDPKADIFIRDPEISRKHAQLVRTEQGYELQDLGSTNGTFIESHQLGDTPVLLKSGQMVTFGKAAVLVYQAWGKTDSNALRQPSTNEVAVPELPPAPAVDEAAPTANENSTELPTLNPPVAKTANKQAAPAIAKTERVDQPDSLPAADAEKDKQIVTAVYIALACFLLLILLSTVWVMLRSGA